MLHVLTINYLILQVIAAKWCPVNLELLQHQQHNHHAPSTSHPLDLPLGMPDSNRSARTIFIYNKGSNGYTLLDTDDSTPLYNVTLDDRHRPHMVVRRAVDDESVVGTASFYPYKKGGIFFATSRIRTEFTLGSRTVPVREEKDGPFSAGKRCFDGVKFAGSRLTWKVGVTTTAFLRLVDQAKRTVATYRSEVHTLRRVGRMDVFLLGDGAGEEQEGWLDEVVVSGLAVVTEQKMLWRMHVGWGDA